jgi:hypothetical protein
MAFGLLLLADLLVILVSFDLNRKSESMNLSAIRTLKGWNLLQARLNDIGKQEIALQSARVQTERAESMARLEQSVTAFQAALDEFEDRLDNPRTERDFDDITRLLGVYRAALRKTAIRPEARAEAIAAYGEISSKLSLISETDSAQFEKETLRRTETDRVILYWTNGIALSGVGLAGVLFLLYRPKEKGTQI